MDDLIGKTYHWCRRKYHIVAAFKDDGEQFFVVKTWNKYRRWWSYSVESNEAINYYINDKEEKIV